MTISFFLRVYVLVLLHRPTLKLSRQYVNRLRVK